MVNNSESQQELVTIPYFVYEANMARLSKTYEADMERLSKTNELLMTVNKRAHILNIILFVILAVIISVFICTRQFEKVTETTIQEITQDTDSGGNNYSIIGGDYSNGEANNKNNEN